MSFHSNAGGQDVVLIAVHTSVVNFIQKTLTETFTEVGQGVFKNSGVSVICNMLVIVLAKQYGMEFSSRYRLDSPLFFSAMVRN